jgi:hypothetical protein
MTLVRVICTPYPREIDPVPIVQESGWVPGPAWMGANNLAPTGIYFNTYDGKSQQVKKNAGPPGTIH